MVKKTNDVMKNNICNFDIELSSNQLRIIVLIVIILVIILLFRKNFEKIFERGKAATNVLSEMMARGGAGGSNTEVSGKVDFGEIRVKIDAPGVDTSMLDKALNSRQFTNQIMSMVANQKSFYTNQATLQG
jgi:hypothetical protein